MVLTAVVIAVVAAYVVFTKHSAGSKTGKNKRSQRRPFLVRIDLDRNGTISQSEAESAWEKRFADAELVILAELDDARRATRYRSNDINDDGNLTRYEFVTTLTGRRVRSADAVPATLDEYDRAHADTTESGSAIDANAGAASGTTVTDSFNVAAPQSESTRDRRRQQLLFLLTLDYDGDKKIKRQEIDRFWTFRFGADTVDVSPDTLSAWSDDFLLFDLDRDGTLRKQELIDAIKAIR